MKITYVIIFLVIVMGLVGGTGYLLFKDKVTFVEPSDQVQKIDDVVTLVDFSYINPEFLFSAKIPEEFEVEYMPQLKAIHIYNPALKGSNNIEKSQVYISFFKASKFLTLSTVNITRQDNVTVKGREAILYEITKKAGVPHFSGQPSWRNVTHEALDIRATKDNPSYFYSFAYAPDLGEKTFYSIIDSLVFINQTNLN